MHIISIVAIITMERTYNIMYKIMYIYIYIYLVKISLIVVVHMCICMFVWIVSSCIQLVYSTVQGTEPITPKRTRQVGGSNGGDYHCRAKKEFNY